MAYSETANKGDLQRLWAAYFEKEKEIYAQLLKNPDEVVKGTVKELAEKYDVDIMTMTGFLDGIDESLVESNPNEETRKALYKEQKSSTTIVKDKKVYPNDPCPCGSGKKYKKCCGKNK